MKLHIVIDNNPKNDLVIEYPIIDYYRWRNSKDYDNDKHIIQLLNVFLKDLDVSKHYIYGRVNQTKTVRYFYNLEQFYYYLVKLDNQFYYNIYLDKLIELHKANVYYEAETRKDSDNKSNERKSTKTKGQNRTKAKRPNKYHKLVTTDIVTGKAKYIYVNEKTKDSIESDDPDMLNELNSDKPKKKITLSDVVISFKFKST